MTAYVHDPAHDQHRRDMLIHQYDITPMATTDGQGQPIYGSTKHEPWMHMRGPLTDLQDSRAGRSSMFWETSTGAVVERPLPRWVDHPRIERTKGKPTRYVAHPYHLDSEAFEDFLTLRAAGWRVWVTGRSIYYPGAAVRVAIWRAED